MTTATILQIIGTLVMSYDLFTTSLFDDEGTFPELEKRQKMGRIKRAIYDAPKLKICGLVLLIVGIYLGAQFNHN
jgi:hypothetical protein